MLRPEDEVVKKQFLPNLPCILRVYEIGHAARLHQREQADLRTLRQRARSVYANASDPQTPIATVTTLTYLQKHCPDVTVLDAEWPGQHLMFDVASHCATEEWLMRTGSKGDGGEKGNGDTWGMTWGRKEDEDEEAALGTLAVPCKQKWIRQPSFVLAGGSRG
ncbi:hypothetical protein CYMTET_20280 [Cymbomonas tetramitiformis]|uniref:Uncharacterized protein n=1 Tax=Cymbomonas tetramitiformis TaxID=36881 RepID=A0AAE0G4C8_9CHLO|nr:hypothetical protein CYMTET_20280 [Cymbomonas tetramitiformis]